tara:strand:+ start:717 stop:932 length:216 start_codon:yes stop_codon:yes gene_type:complete
MNKDIACRFIAEYKQKQYFKKLNNQNIIEMDDYFVRSNAVEETNMTIGFTAPFYNTKADRLANHKINNNEK